MAIRRRKVYRGRRSKYNINSQTWNAVPVSEWTLVGGALNAANQPIVQSSPVGGTRKVKNFNVSMTTTVSDEPIFWAIVYVPEGTNPSAPSISGEVRTNMEELKVNGAVALPLTTTGRRVSARTECLCTTTAGMVCT